MAMIAIDRNTARGTLRRGSPVSSASAAEFSQPMNRYTASGNPGASPLNPLFRWLHSNGAADRWLPFLANEAMDTMTRTSISKPKKNPASLVETPTPRYIMYMEPAVSSTEQMIQVSFQAKY